MKSIPFLNTSLAVGIAGLAALLAVSVGSAAWQTTWFNQQVITNFALSGGSNLDGTVSHRFETTSNYAQIHGANIASEVLVEIYVYVEAQDRCVNGGTWITYAYTDKVQYNSQGAGTSHTPPTTANGAGEYQDCSSFHQYRWYIETWGVDPPPNWQWTGAAHTT